SVWTRRSRSSTPSTPSSASRTTPPSPPCAGWWRPGTWAGSRGRASTTTADQSRGPLTAHTGRMEIDGVATWLRSPVEPPASRWSFPDPRVAGGDDLVAVGGDLQPGTVLGAYRRGLFPMNINRRHLGWWSPQERGIIPLDEFVPSRSLRRSRR